MFLPEKLVLPRPRDAIDMMKDVYDKRQPYGSGSSYGRELEHPHTLAPSLDEGEFYLFAALLFGYKTAPLTMVEGGGFVVAHGPIVFQGPRSTAPDVPA